MPIHVNVDLEIKFRELAMKKNGYSKRALRKALEEAILLRIEKNKETQEHTGRKAEVG